MDQEVSKARLLTWATHGRSPQRRAQGSSVDATDGSDTDYRHTWQSTGGKAAEGAGTVKRTKQSDREALAGIGSQFG